VTKLKRSSQDSTRIKGDGTVGVTTTVNNLLTPVNPCKILSSALLFTHGNISSAHDREPWWQIVNTKQGMPQRRSL
jgi:hypothetical protein